MSFRSWLTIGLVLSSGMSLMACSSEGKLPEPEETVAIVELPQELADLPLEVFVREVQNRADRGEISNNERIALLNAYKEQNGL